jgi:predicted DNA-binding protein (MmcQ/YjbR family)
MLQNSIANVPNLANVLILYRQTKTSAGLPDKITLRQFVSLLAQQAQVYDNGRIRTSLNYRRSAATHELEYEINAHDFDQDEEEDLDPDEWFEAHVMNQRNPKTGRYLGNKNGNKSTGFKKTQNYKRQANQMQGNQSGAFMNRDTWNALGDSGKKAWDQLSDAAKTKITA